MSFCEILTLTTGRETYILLEYPGDKYDVTRHQLSEDFYAFVSKS